MPSDPENRIEELLKTYARKRQEDAGAPLELHSATRKVLQDEVARQQSRAPQRRPSWFSQMLLFWPRLAMTASILIALGLAAWMWFPPLARQETAFATRDEGAAAPEQLQAHRSALPEPQPTITPPEVPTEFSKTRREVDRAAIAPAEKPVLIEATPAAPAIQPARENNGAREGLALNEALRKDDEKGWRAKSPSLANEPIPTQPKPNPRPAAGPTAAGAQSPAFSHSLTGVKATNGAIARRYSSSDRVPPGNLPTIPPPLTLADARDAQSQRGVGLADTAAKDVPAAEPALPASAIHTMNERARLSAKVNDAYYWQRGLAAGGISNAALPRLRFVQTTPPAEPELKQALARTPTVLSQFEVKQDGARVQLVDFDGSVYDGSIVTSNESRAIASDAVSDKTKSEVERPPVRREEVRQQTPGLEGVQSGNWGQSDVAFRVSGTSRYLGQPIVVEGTMMLSAENSTVSNAAAPTPAPSRARNPSSARAVDSRQAGVAVEGKTATGVANPGQVQRVIGKVRIGATNEVRLDAVPAPN